MSSRGSTLPSLQLHGAAADISEIMTSFVEGQSDPAILLTPELELVASNTSFAALVGLRAKAIERKLRAGGSIFDLFSSDELTREVFADVIAKGQRACLYDVNGKSHRGDDFIVIATFLPIREPHGGCAALMVLLRDVTAEVGLQQTYKELLHAEHQRGNQLEEQVAARTHDLQRALDEVTKQAAELEKSRQREVALQKSVFAGRLATGLAHEFNSPLACVLSNQSYLKSRLEELAAVMDASNSSWTEFFSEATDVIDENKRSMERLSATLRTLQEFVLTNENDESNTGPSPVSIAEVLRDTQLELTRSAIDAGDVEFADSDESIVSAYGAEISLAIHSLIRFLLEHEAEPGHRGDAPLCLYSLAPEPKAPEPRRVCVRAIEEESHCLVVLTCQELDIDIDEAENAFDPSLVVDSGNRVKLSVDLSVCAARIARSGGSVEFNREIERGTQIEIRLMRALGEASAA